MNSLSTSGTRAVRIDSANGFSLRLDGRRLLVSGVLAGDPYLGDAESFSTTLEDVRLTGNNADHWDIRDRLKNACESLGLHVLDDQHSLITYESDQDIPRSTFIVPARWRHCADNVREIPGLLDLRTHFERLFDRGRPLVAQALGECVADDVFSIAFGRNLKDRGLVTAIEYASHSFCHSVHMMLHDPRVGPHLENWQARAAEECRADRLATRLVLQSFGEEIALAILASQFLTRVTCDYFAASESTESMAHRAAAIMTIEEFGLLPHFSGRTSDPSFSRCDSISRLKAVLDARAAVTYAEDMRL
jgi:hypothetical protein